MPTPRGAKRIKPQAADPDLRKPEATAASKVDSLRDDRERLFVYYYVLRPDPQWAAMSAGYSASTGTSKAYQWTNPGGPKPWIYEAIQAALNKHAKKLDITTERVLAGLAELAFSNVLDFGQVREDGSFAVDMTKTSREQFGAVQEVTVRERKTDAAKDKPAETDRVTKLKLAEKRPALVDLGRHLGMFKEGDPVPQSVTFVIQGRD